MNKSLASVLLEELNSLNLADKYRVLEKYQKPLLYNQDNGCPKKLGLFVDVETTGLNYKNDRVIEIALVLFEYSEDGLIYRIVDEYNEFQDPYMPISEEISNLTGITDEQVEGKSIDLELVMSYFAKADLVFAHNAKFDRPFVEKLVPELRLKTWVCTLAEIDWKKEKIESAKLEYLAYKYGFFYDNHRALNDCLAGIHLLAQVLPVSGVMALKVLIDKSKLVTYKIWAVSAPYESKDLLKERKYVWDDSPTAQHKAWSKELPKEKIHLELLHLIENIYKRKVELPIDEIKPYFRYSCLDKEELIRREEILNTSLFFKQSGLDESAIFKLQLT